MSAARRDLPIIGTGDGTGNGTGDPMGRGTPPAAVALPDLRDDDLHDVLTDFYERVARDELLAPYFAVVDMREHMPRIVAFWSTLLFHTARYSGNAFRPHLSMPGLTSRHFAHWLGVLEATVDSRHAGEVAERMKELGHRVAYSMQVRLRIEPDPRSHPRPA